MDKVICAVFVLIVIFVITSLLYLLVLDLEANVMCILYGYDSGYATLTFQQFCVDKSALLPSAVPLWGAQ